MTRLPELLNSQITLYEMKLRSEGYALGTLKVADKSLYLFFESFLPRLEAQDVGVSDVLDFLREKFALGKSVGWMHRTLWWVRKFYVWLDLPDPTWGVNVRQVYLGEFPAGMPEGDREWDN